MKHIFLFLLLFFNAMAYEAFITPSQLKSSLDNKNLILLDVSPIESYNTSHIKGALHLDISKFIRSKYKRIAVDFSKDVHKEIKKLGINKNSYIVIYSRRSDKEQLYSTYLAFTLVQHGFENISILDGGYMAWVFKFYNLVSSKKSSPKKDTTSKISYNATLFADSSYKDKKSKEVIFIDGKNYKEYFLNDFTLKSDEVLKKYFIDTLDLDSSKEIVIDDEDMLRATANWYILYKKFGFTKTKIYKKR